MNLYYFVLSIIQYLRKQDLYNYVYSFDVWTKNFSLRKVFNLQSVFFSFDKLFDQIINFQAKCQGKEHMIESEIAILSSVSHPHVIQLEEVFDFAAEKYLIMEYVQVLVEKDLLIGDICDGILHMLTAADNPLCIDLDSV